MSVRSLQIPRRQILALSLAVAALALGGCATGTPVRASGYVSPGASVPGSGRVHIEAQADAPNPLVTDLVRDKAAQLMTVRGYQPVPDAAGADLVLETLYAMSARSVLISRPSATTFSPVQQVVVTGSGDTVAVMSGNDAVTYIPETYTVYDAKLTVRLYAAADRTRALWVGEATAEGSEPDARQTLDELVASALKYLGQDTGRSKELDVRRDDPDVRRLRGQAP
ncbi:MAG: hypothetical protein MOGMAGMI_01582 [Candidatus Omnitrophica bacterium]|nr:hypothetical protein [Candidatus Omnitrophota bacterium]